MNQKDDLYKAILSAKDDLYKKTILDKFEKLKEKDNFYQTTLSAKDDLIDNNTKYYKKLEKEYAEVVLSKYINSILSDFNLLGTSPPVSTNTPVNEYIKLDMDLLSKLNKLEEHNSNKLDNIQNDKIINKLLKNKMNIDKLYFKKLCPTESDSTKTVTQWNMTDINKNYDLVEYVHNTDEQSELNSFNM